MSQQQKKLNVIDSFLLGARDGWQIGITAMLPAIVMVFALMQILTFTNVLSYIGIAFEPVMRLFGLPGEAATPLLFCIVTVSGALVMTADLAMKSLLTSDQVVMLVPALMLMGSQLSYMARVLGASNIKTKHYPYFFLVGYINGLLALLFMRIIV